MTKGVCRNSACTSGRSATVVEMYPGPGEYCPECGDALQPVAAGVPDTPPAPFGGLSALEALTRFDAAQPPVDPPPAPPSPVRKRLALAGISVVVAVVAAAAVLRPTAAQRPAVADAVRVCGSSVTERFATDMVRAYAEKSGVAASRFAVTPSGPCDVRFTAGAERAGDVIGHDGIVVVVNPQNPLTRLTENDVRLIFTGAITDWAQFGEPPGRIVALMPLDGSDEAQSLGRTLLAHGTAGANVRRVASSADVVHAVVSAGGRGTIGLAAFSAAVPAKVLAIAPQPAPSLLSIANRRYALTVALTVESASHAAPAAGLAAFARSADAQAIVLRDGFVPKKGI